MQTLKEAGLDPGFVIVASFVRDEMVSVKSHNFLRPLVEKKICVIEQEQFWSGENPFLRRWVHVRQVFCSVRGVADPTITQALASVKTTQTW